MMNSVPYVGVLTARADVRGAQGPTGRRAAQAVHVAGAARARDPVTRQGLRRRRIQAQQVVAELHQEKVHGQGAVACQSRGVIEQWIHQSHYMTTNTAL